jgi:hypothetical protein
MPLRLLALVTACLMLQACATSADLKRGGTGQSFVVQGKSYDQVWDASLRTLGGVSDDRSLDIQRNLRVTSSDKAAGRIEATSDISFWSYGEIVGVFITPPRNAPEHEIYVESLSKVKTNVTSNNWEDEVITAIKAELQTR